MYIFYYTYPFLLEKISCKENLLVGEFITVVLKGKNNKVKGDDEVEMCWCRQPTIDQPPKKW